MKHRLGLIQMNSRHNLKENLAFAEQQITQASAEGLDLVAFPEMFLCLDKKPTEKFKVAQSLEGDLVQTFQDYANTHKISILMGSIYEEVPDDPNRLFNTSVLLNRDGEIEGVYRKIHLCDIDSPQVKNVESEHIQAGADAVVVDHEIGKIGLSICYDIRFPALFQSLREKGAEIIFAPSAFFLQTGKDHWIPLLKARAIENQVYIAAPAQWGNHYDDRFSYGSSVLIDPWGTVVVCASEGTGLFSGTIDLEYLHNVRERMPIFSHRRPECY